MKLKTTKEYRASMRRSVQAGNLFNRREVEDLLDDLEETLSAIGEARGALAEVERAVFRPGTILEQNKLALELLGGIRRAWVRLRLDD